MLRIKDNVDLKELEKFGFELSCTGIYVGKNTCICKNRNIMGIGGTTSHSKMRAVEELYDLIKAGLVEKVSN